MINGDMKYCMKNIYKVQAVYNIPSTQCHSWLKATESGQTFLYSSKLSFQFEKPRGRKTCDKMNIYRRKVRSDNPIRPLSR